MRQRSQNLARRGLLAISVASLLAAIAAEAQARTELLRWTHPRTDVQLFEVRVTFADGTSQIRSLIDPVRDGEIFRSDVEVGEGDVRVALRATGPNNILSAWTIDQFRAGGGGSSTVPVAGGTPIQPTVGAAARYDFSTNPVGSNINGWIDTASGYSLAVDDSLFDVVDLGGNRILHTDSNQADIHSHVAVVVAGNPWSNFELRGRMAVDHPDGSIGVTTYSGYPNADTYYRLGRSANGSIRLEGRPALSCDGIDSGLVPAAGEWIRFELDVIDNGSSNRIRAKVWRQGAIEPSQPQIDCEDFSESHLALGTVGVWAGGPGQKYWDDFEVIQGVGSFPSAPPAPPILIQIVPVEP